jgi:hypothetical protein
MLHSFVININFNAGEMNGNVLVTNMGILVTNMNGNITDMNVNVKIIMKLFNVYIEIY